MAPNSLINQSKTIDMDASFIGKMSEICDLSSSDDSDIEYFSIPTQLPCEKKIFDLNVSFNSEDSLEYVYDSKIRSTDASRSAKGIIISTIFFEKYK